MRMTAAILIGWALAWSALPGITEAGEATHAARHDALGARAAVRRVDDLLARQRAQWAAPVQLEVTSPYLPRAGNDGAAADARIRRIGELLRSAPGER
jgi:hypothetical protein